MPVVAGRAIANASRCARPTSSMSRGVGDVDPRAHDVVERRAGLLERARDDLEADPRLLVGVVGRVGVVGHDRRRARDPDLAADADGPRVADAVLEGGAGGDQLAIHAGSVAVVDALRQVDGWPCEHAAVAVVYPDGAAVDARGASSAPLRWASVTKLATAVAVLVAVEEGIVDLDDPAGPPGSTRAPSARARLGAAVRRRRRRSRRPGRGGSTRTAGFELLAEHVAAAAEMPFAEYFEAVWGFPLGGSPAHGIEAPLDAAASRSRASSSSPARIAGETLAEAATRAVPGARRRRCPGFGRCDPNDWGLGLELRDGKQPALDGCGELAARPSATSAAAARSSGSIPPPASRSPASPTSSSATGRNDAWPRLADAVLAESTAPAAASTRRFGLFGRGRVRARARPSASLRPPAPAARRSRTASSSGSTTTP